MSNIILSASVNMSSNNHSNNHSNIIGQIQSDRNGNIYLVITDDINFINNKIYFILSVDPDADVCLVFTKIKNPDLFKIKNYDLLNRIQTAEIKNYKTDSLKHKIVEHINHLPDELKNEMFSDFDESIINFPDNMNYRLVINNENDNINNDINNDIHELDFTDVTNSSFYLCGVSESNSNSNSNFNIVHSELLFDTEGTFNTIYIDDCNNTKSINSVIERADGWFVNKIAVYQSGYIEVILINKLIKYKLSLDFPINSFDINDVSINCYEFF
jgi:hypothetical protein